MSKVTQDARRINLPEEKLLGDWIVCIPGFTLDKYRELQGSHLSILAYDCFGGMLSHLLGLPFFSPFVNLSFIQSKYFVQFLRDPHGYLEKNLIEQPSAKYKYPVAKMGNISLHMMHYKIFEEAVDAWESRKSRINWNNLFVTMCTADKKDLEQFDVLPYDKKVCFVPFRSDLPSAWYINLEIDKYARDIAHTVRRFGEGRIFYYDPFDMLLYGKKTPLIDM